MRTVLPCISVLLLWPVSLLAETVYEHASAEIDRRIKVADKEELKVFDKSDHIGGLFDEPDYRWNSEAWTADLDLSCLLVRNLNNSPSNQFGGALVTPRHVLTAAHSNVYYKLGHQLRFVGRDGQFHDREIVAKQSHPKAKGLSHDIHLLQLDRDLPDTVSVAKLLPTSWDIYLPHLRGLPILGMNQHREARITELRQVDRQANGNTVIAMEYAKEAPRTDYRLELVRGDSGSPAFLLVDGQLVLLTTWTTGGAGQGSWLVAHRRELDRMIEQLNQQSKPAVPGRYRLQDVDLSRFEQLKH